MAFQKEQIKKIMICRWNEKLAKSKTHNKTAAFQTFLTFTSHITTNSPPLASHVLSADILIHHHNLSQFIAVVLRRYKDTQRCDVSNDSTATMGNTQTKEARPNSYEPTSLSGFPQPESSLSQLFVRERDNGDRERTIEGLELRREAKAEREARRSERERVTRENEREKSMREEHVDAGYLVTQGVYTGPEDYAKPVVRQFMVSGALIGES